MMSLWLSSPWPGSAVVVPSTDGSILTVKGAGFRRKPQLYPPLPNASRLTRKEEVPSHGLWGRVPAALVAFMVPCEDQHNVVLFHPGEEVELCYKDLPWLSWTVLQGSWTCCVLVIISFICELYNYGCSRVCRCISLQFPMHTFLSHAVCFILRV